MIEPINHNSRMLVLIFRANYRAEDIQFFTPNDFSQQLGYMNRPQGYVIPPHVHNPVGQQPVQHRPLPPTRKSRL